MAQVRCFTLIRSGQFADGRHSELVPQPKSKLGGRAGVKSPCLSVEVNADRHVDLRRRRSTAHLSSSKVFATVCCDLKWREACRNICRT